MLILQQKASNLLYITNKMNMVVAVNIMVNKNTWGVKKVRGQAEPATKSSDIKKSVNKSASRLAINFWALADIRALSCRFIHRLFGLILLGITLLHPRLHPRAPALEIQFWC